MGLSWAWPEWVPELSLCFNATVNLYTEQMHSYVKNIYNQASFVTAHTHGAVENAAYFQHFTRKEGS